MTVGNRSVHSCCWQLSKYNPSPNSEKFDIFENWNHPAIQNLRKGVLSGSFDGCNKNTCFNILGNSLPLREDEMKNPRWKNVIENNIIEVAEIPDQLHFEADPTCNLACPMCRDGFNVGRDVDINFGKGVLWDVLEKVKKSGKKLLLSMCGNGEPFMSRSCRDFLFNADLRDCPNLTVGFNTNGLLLTPYLWDKMGKTRGNFRYINWSVEGATKEGYEKCRVGGSYEKFIENVDFMNSIKKDFPFLFIQFAYVCHADSYKEMALFIKWTRERWGWPMHFARYIPNSLSQEKRLNIFDPTHPLHQDFLEEMKNPIFTTTSNVSMTNLTPFLPKVG